MNSVKKVTICILGAGPAGAAAALQLNQYGIACTVIDKAVFPRDKVCGDGLSGKVVTLLDRIDPAIAIRLNELNVKQDSMGVTFIASNRAALNIPYRLREDKLAPSLVCKRIDFDHFLVTEMKRCAHIDVIEGQSIDQYQLTDSGYLLSGKQNGFQLETQLLIVANGAHSGFTKEVAGIHMDTKHYCAGLRAYYKNVGDLNKDGNIELHFLKSVLPGYFWIFPLPGGAANVGIGMLSEVVRRKKINLKQLLQETIASDPVLKYRFKDAELCGTIDGYGLPLGSKKRILSGDRYMLIGDAGHLIDPFTGEGIGNALYSGRFAAEQAKLAIEAGNFSAGQLKAYDDTIRNKLGPELKLSARLQQLVQRPWLFNYLLKIGMGNKQLRELMSCMFYELDLRKKLTRPVFYIKLLFNLN